MSKHHAVKAYTKVGIKLHTLQISGLAGGEWLASFSSCFSPRDSLWYSWDQQEAEWAQRQSGRGVKEGK
jgi:hypothetical protein